MGLFDQLKVNGFMTHLELAVKHSDCPSISWNHVRSALTAMRKIQAKRIETLLTSQGWKYVVHLSTQLGMFAAATHADNALQDIQWITDQAIKWRDEAYARECEQYESESN
jgi:hypothetical protein